MHSLSFLGKKWIVAPPHHHQQIWLSGRHPGCTSSTTTTTSRLVHYSLGRNGSSSAHSIGQSLKWGSSVYRARSFRKSLRSLKHDIMHPYSIYLASDKYRTTTDNIPTQISSSLLLLIATGLSSMCIAMVKGESLPAHCEAPSDNAVHPPVAEEDPYENLPEEDEETDCSMCNTFRKGPCRPFWRKLERCFKDQDKEGGDAQNCMPYFYPHQECLSKYVNLYQLVSLEVKQELVASAETSIEEHERRKWKIVPDWSKYKEFIGEVGSTFSQLRKNVSPDSPLWERVQEETEPVLVATHVQIPKKDEKSGLLLKIAYALDQDGTLLGLGFNDEYGRLLKLAKKDSDVTDDDEPEKQKPTEEGSDSINFELEFFILPGSTEAVCIKGLYTEDPTKVDSDKAIMDALLFESSLYELSNIVNP